MVVDVARKYFAMPDSPRLKVDVEDGRRYLQRNEQRYDVIALDAYFSDSIPFHLATAEFVDLVRQRLAPGGVVVANIIGSVEGPGSRLFRSFVRTYRTAFPTVAVHPVIEEGDGGGLTELRNLMLVASEGALPSEEFLLERWRELAPVDRSGSREADPRPLRQADPHRGRADADGRLRAHGFPPPGGLTGLRFGGEPKWRNWQTRRTQNPVPERACGFDPHLRHRESCGATRSPPAPPAALRPRATWH